VSRSQNLGNIVPHILALKVGALLLFPTYVEYVSYCSGFMYVDLPWLNSFFAINLADARDRSPSAYSLFYTNMNFASMYLFALCIIVLLSAVGVIVGRNIKQKNYVKVNAYFVFLYNFFFFGATFAGCASLQGAVLNPITSLSVNGVFYIIGILIYFSVVCECIYKLNKDTMLNFWKIRILLKTTILSLSHYSPIYLLSAAVVTDLLLAAVEYRIAIYPKLHSKLWVFANVMVNVALLLLLLLSFAFLVVIIVSVCVAVIIIAEGIMHYQ
jgi:hypothetical protein